MKEAEQRKRRGHKTQRCTGDKEAAAKPRQQWCIIVSGCLLIGQDNEQLKVLCLIRKLLETTAELCPEPQPAGKLCFCVWL